MTRGSASKGAGPCLRNMQALLSVVFEPGVSSSMKAMRTKGEAAAVVLLAALVNGAVNLHDSK